MQQAPEDPEVRAPAAGRSTGPGWPAGRAAPAPVLVVVDVDRAEVVRANASARLLTPGLALPVGVDAWSQAAGLTGSRRTSEPLLDLARGLGEHTDGQPVHLRDRDGRDTRMVAHLLPAAGQDATDGEVIVVLLPDDVGATGTTTRAGGARDDAGPLHGAVRATSMSFTVADAQAPDAPLVFVNPAFTVTTGYRADEVLGRNCRFLQGPGTDPAAVARLRSAVTAGEDVTVTLLNHRKDGTPFWNSVAISPVRDDRGHLTHLVGVQTDVTEAERTQRERDAALEAATVANAALHAVNERQRLLGELTDDLTAHLSGTAEDRWGEGVEAAASRLAERVVPALADWCVVTLLEGEGTGRGPGGLGRRPRDVASAHALEALRPVVSTFARDRLPHEGPSSSLRAALLAVLGGGGPTTVPLPAWDGTGGTAAGAGGHGCARSAEEALRVLAPVSMTVVPLVGRGRTVGALSLFHGAARGPATSAERADAVEVGTRAGLLLDNALLHRQQRALAAGLQSLMLSAPPTVEGLQIAVGYRPAARGADVGGDWYDAYVTAGGSVDLVVGDVVGHDTAAAAAMGQLRTITRTTAEVTRSGPAEVLATVDRTMARLGPTATASAVLARVRGVPSGGAELLWSNAGHPPPLVLGPDGTVTVLQQSSADLLLGVRADTPRTEHVHRLQPGSTLVLYTDGLVERRDRDLRAGLEELAAHLRRLSDRRTGLDELVGEVVRAMVGETADDDVAVLAARVRG